jgi:hypothetical protein
MLKGHQSKPARSEPSGSAGKGTTGVTPMSERKIIQIGYRPREQFKSFHKRKQRWSVLVCHRRAGKTVATLNDLIRGAVNEPKHEGRYASIFPQRNQAKDNQPRSGSSSVSVGNAGWWTTTKPQASASITMSRC